MRQRMLLTGIATVAVVSLGLSGCSSLLSETGTGGLEDVTIAVEPLIGSAAVYLGAQEGFFADEGIDLTINSLPANSKAVVEMVAAGNAAFGLSDTLTLLVEHSSGTPVKVLSGAYSSTSDPNSDFAALVVKQDSPITTITDIQGKIVSTAAPRSLDETVVQGMISDDGGNPAGVHFVKVPPSAAIGALESDEVDVAFLVEPYLSWAVEAGHRVLSYPYVEYVNYLNVAAFFTSSETAENNPELAERFTSAVEKSLTFAQNNPQAARDIFATYTTTEEGTRTTLIMPRFTPTIERPALEKLGVTAKEHGIIFADPDLDSLLP
ncbi:MAG TPA: ABC transporter substrate-binding protein [Homoserinimonas sp.]|nr:ABC transporter substrate-binding protein [Homoserinimonas sp.]